VQVIAQGVVGPYETVTLQSSDPNALGSWLTSHGFDIPPSMGPTIDAYVAAKFDFIAIRLRPECGVQSMQPVRVRTPGADPTLPLRMVAAGVGANVDVLLWVVGEGRWQPQNFASATIDDSHLVWDVSHEQSNYAALVESTMAQMNGTTWVTEYASPVDLTGAGVSSNGSNPGLAQAYLGFCGGAVPSNGSTIVAPQPCDAMAPPPGPIPLDSGVEASAGSEAAAPESGSDGEADGGDAGAPDAADAEEEGGPDATTEASSDASVDAGALEAGEAGGDAASDASGDDGGLDNEGGTAFDASSPTDPCASFDDLTAATSSLRIGDIWVTRLRAKLPVAALAQDLVLQASPQQISVSNVHYAPASTSPPASGSDCESAPHRRESFSALALAALTAAGVSLLRRRNRKT
jgi:hypothetical protein